MESAARKNGPAHHSADLPFERNVIGSEKDCPETSTSGLDGRIRSLVARTSAARPTPVFSACRDSIFFPHRSRTSGLPRRSRVAGMRIVPASAYLEMALSAAESGGLDVAAEPIALHAVAFLQPCVFDEPRTLQCIFAAKKLDTPSRSIVVPPMRMTARGATASMAAPRHRCRSRPRRAEIGRRKTSRTAKGQSARVAQRSRTAISSTAHSTIWASTSVPVSEPYVVCCEGPE